MLGAARLLDRRPALAGILLGLAAVKPHLLPIFGIAFIAAARWRTLTFAVLAAASLALASLAIYGSEVWWRWLTDEVPFQSSLYVRATGGWVAFTTSPLGFARSFAPLPFAVAFQVAVTLMAATAVGSRFVQLKRGSLGTEDFVLLLAAGLAASPYSFGYDAVGLTGAIVLALSRPSLIFGPARRLGITLLWSSPIGGIFLSVLAFALSGRIVSLGGLFVVAGLLLVIASTPRQETLVSAEP
jgi:hypothetical protein